MSSHLSCGGRKTAFSHLPYSRSPELFSIVDLVIAVLCCRTNQSFNMTRAGRVQKGGKAKATKRASSRADLPDVYADMLSEALSSPAQVSDEGKTIKKRRIASRFSGEGRDLKVDTQAEKLQDIESIRDAEKGTGTSFEQAKQQIFDESEDSEPSDGDWEDVDFAKPIMYQEEPLGRDDSGDGDLNLVLETGDREAQRQTTLKRKPITQAEKKLRVDIHKMHLLCLLFHVHVRNHWCNNEKVHVIDDPPYGGFARLMACRMHSKVCSQLGPDLT